MQQSSYDLSRPLASALRATAPYIGIPMPGFAPLAFDRKRLAGALTGVRVLNMEVITVETSGTRWLRIEGSASDGRVRTCCTIKAIPTEFWKQRAGRDALEAWRDAEQRSRSNATTAPVSAPARKAAATAKRAASTLRKLERELDKMGKPWLPNPAVPRLRGPSTPDLVIAELRRTRRQRTIVGAIAAQARRESWTSGQLYKQLTARGLEFKKMSEMSGTYRKVYGAEYFSDYLKHLHRFTYGTGLYLQNKIYQRGARPEDPGRWGGARYVPYMEELRAWQSIEAQIASVRELMAEAGARAGAV